MAAMSNLAHLHHGLEGAPRCLGVGIAYRLDEGLGVICQEMPHLSWHQPHLLA